jgi:hypothetical protein
MKIGKIQILQCAGVVAIGMLLGMSSADSWAGGHKGHKAHKGKSQTCFQTTRVMHKACRADVIDDFYEESAKCLNSDEARECRREVRDEYVEAWGGCWEQAESRDSLCQRLPDAGPYIVELDPADFTGVCTQGNEYYPLIPGTVTTFVNEEEDEEETIVVTVTDETREIEGIETIVVRDTVYEGLPDEDGNPDGDRIEDTDDYYAIDNDCNVWYLGEVSQNFEDGYLDNLDGSFIAGVEGAQAGIIMLGDPMVGDVYRQEFALGDAEDAGAVLSLGTDIFDEEGDTVTFDNDRFNCDNSCLKTEDFIANEPDGTEFKYFKKGVGFVAEQLPDGEVVLKIIKEEALP